VVPGIAPQDRGPLCEKQLGFEPMLSFRAWGDDEAETMAHLNRTRVNLGVVLPGLVG
jgi:hypothetical protein